jgi:hypothetical protein
MPAAIGIAVLAAAAIAVLLMVRLNALPAAASPLLLALTTAAVLLVPATSSVHLVSAGASSSGRPGYAPPARVAALSTYLTKHQGHAHYEVASTTVAKTGPLIVRDGRPVLMLTSLYNRPLLTATALADRVARKQVRFVLIGRGTCTSHTARCPPVISWARNHSVDVSRAAHLPAGTLYRFDRPAT